MIVHLCHRRHRIPMAPATSSFQLTAHRRPRRPSPPPRPATANSSKLAPAGKTTASWFTQFSTLLHRNFVVAKRDYSLYYLQCVATLPLNSSDDMGNPSLRPHVCKH